MCHDWGVIMAIHLPIQHAFVYLTEELEFVTIPEVPSRHHLGMGRHSRKVGFRKIKVFIEITALDALTSTGSCEGQNELCCSFSQRLVAYFGSWPGENYSKKDDMRWVSMENSELRDVRSLPGEWRVSF